MTDDDYHVTLYELGTRAVVLGWCESALFAAEHIGRDRFPWLNLCHGQREWVWRVPLGLKRDEEGMPARSLGSVLMDAENILARHADLAKKQVTAVALTVEQAREVNPEFVAMFADANEDDA